MKNETIYHIAKDLLEQCIYTESDAKTIYDVLLGLHTVVEDYEADVIYNDIKLDFTNNIYQFSREPQNGESFEGVYTRNKIVKLGTYRGTCILNSETNQLDFSMVINLTDKNITVVITKEGNIWKQK